MTHPAAQLRERLARGDQMIAMGAWDILSAKVMERAGIDMLSLNSFALSSIWGVPDVGLRTASDLLDLTFKMAGETSLPLVLDIEQGFGSGPGHAAYWAREFERAGAASVLIDDKGPVQMCTWLPGAKDQISISPVEETAAKIGAMADARREGLVILARCSLASGAAFDVDEEMRRLRAYAEAGADMLYAPKHATMANDLGALKRARDELGKPVFVQFNPPGYIRAYVPEGSTDGRSIADQSYADLFAAVARKVPVVPVDGLNLMIDDAKSYNPKIAQDPPQVDSLYDNSIVEELQQSGFIDAAFANGG